MNRIIKKSTALFLAILLLLPVSSFSQILPYMPPVGTLTLQSVKYDLSTLKGIKFDKNNPFKFTFFFNKSDLPLSEAVLKEQAEKIGKYFLAALTIDEKDLWVNLSPYEQNRIIPDKLGQTDLGKDMLGEDYVLKQLAASLTHPDTEAGKKYWQSMNSSLREAQATKQSQTAGIASPSVRNDNANNFQKVWIVPDRTHIYESPNMVVIDYARLKVLTDTDYMAKQKNGFVIASAAKQSQSRIATVGKSLPRNDAIEAFKTHILPTIEKEVNEGKQFAHLRQLYSAIILAMWFKDKLKNSILNSTYFGKNKIKGADISDPNIKQKIYDEYLKAFNAGAYKMVTAERNINKIIKRQYFSGGAVFTRDELTQVTEIDRIPDDTAKKKIIGLPNADMSGEARGRNDLTTAFKGSAAWSSRSDTERVNILGAVQASALIINRIEDYCNANDYYGAGDLALTALKENIFGIDHTHVVKAVNGAFKYNSLYLAGSLLQKAMHQDIPGISYIHVMRTVEEAEPYIAGSVAVEAIRQKIPGVNAAHVTKAVEQLFSEDKFYYAAKLAMEAVRQNIPGVTAAQVLEGVEQLFDINLPEAGGIALEALKQKITGIDTERVMRWKEKSIKLGLRDIAGDIILEAIKQNIPGIDGNQVKLMANDYFNSNRIPDTIDLITKAIKQNVSGIEKIDVMRWRDKCFMPPYLYRVGQMLLEAKKRNILDVRYDNVTYIATQCIRAGYNYDAACLVLEALKQGITGINDKEVAFWVDWCFKNKYIYLWGQYSIEAIRRNIGNISPVQVAQAAQLLIVDAESQKGLRLIFDLQSLSVVAGHQDAIKDILVWAEENSILSVINNPVLMDKLISLDSDRWRMVIQRRDNLFAALARKNSQMPAAIRLDIEDFKRIYGARLIVLEIIYPKTLDYLTDLARNSNNLLTKIKILDSKRLSLKDEAAINDLRDLLAQLEALHSQIEGERFSLENKKVRDLLDLSNTKTEGSAGSRSLSLRVNSDDTKIVDYEAASNRQKAKKVLGARWQAIVKSIADKDKIDRFTADNELAGAIYKAHDEVKMPPESERGTPAWYHAIKKKVKILRRELGKGIFTHDDIKKLMDAKVLGRDLKEKPQATGGLDFAKVSKQNKTVFGGGVEFDFDDTVKFLQSPDFAGLSLNVESVSLK